MTYKEAKQSILSYCVEECGMIESCDFNGFNNCVEALAIKAIEKQIPKKPNFIELGSDKYWLCPVCGDVCLGVLEDDQIKNEYDHDFCGGCGQAIDWREKEDNND